MPKRRAYIPALGAAFLTPLYDILIRVFLSEIAIKRRLVLNASIQSHQRVLDLGCGTGTLAILIKQMNPTATVFGIDPDPAVLTRAARKAAARGVEVTFTRGTAIGLDWPDGSFNRVLSSLVFHHLTTSEKAQASSEVHRVLAPSGSFLLLDFGPPRNFYSRTVSPLFARLEHADANIHGLLPAILQDGGFSAVEAVDHFATLFGTLTMLHATKQSR